MKARTFPLHSKTGRQAIALAVILPLLVVVTLVVIAALSLVTFDSRSASNALQDWKAENFARMAVDQAAEKLAGIPLDKHWAAAPGRIRHWTGSQWDTINLYSEGDSSDQVDLNGPLADGTAAILPANVEFPTAPEMKVDWVYVRQDGAQTSAPAYDANNPVVGRFAYWTDIENGRVNLNTAGFGMIAFDSHLENMSAFQQPVPLTYPPTIRSEYEQNVWAMNPWMTDAVNAGPDGLEFSVLNRTTVHERTLQNLVAHPSSIDLSYLDGISEEESFNTFRYAGSYFLRADARNSYLKFDGSSWITAQPDLSVRRFNTPEDWKSIVSEDAYRRNKGYLTTRGRTPEITPWGSAKLPLSLLRNDSNFLNDMSEETLRATQTTANGPIFGNGAGIIYGVQDSRAVNVPAIHAWVPHGTPSNRGSLRDLSAPYPTHGSEATVASLIDTVKNVLDVPVPGFTSSLADKYNAQGSPGEAEQVAVEMLTYADSALNGFAPGWSSFMIAREPAIPYDSSGPVAERNYPKKLFSGRWNPKAKNSTERRLGSAGPFLVNELTLTANVSSQGEQAGVYALSAGLPEVNPPEAVITNAGNGNVILFLLRAPVPGDVFIALNMDAEIATPARYGFSQELRAVGFFGLISDLVCTYSSDDPLAPGGTLRFHNGNVKTVMNSSGQSLFPFPQQGCLFLHGDASRHPRPASGIHYSAMRRWSNCRILLGPFAAGTTVSFNLKPKFVFSIDAGSGSWWPGGTSRIWTMVPGIFTDTLGTDPAAMADPEDYLEFNFENFDTAFGVGFGETLSFEINDPRVSRKKTNWQNAGTGSMGFQNSVYTGGGSSSDLAKPDALMQVVRSRLRAYAFSSSWGGSQDKTEYQNASRILGLPGVGFLSSVPTGVDSGLPWQTMKFHANNDTPPDWLLWSLFYVPFDRSIANQTDGKLNINATLYPFGIQRTKPLEALLGGRASNRTALASNIANRVASGPLAGPSDLLVYPGQLCQITGFADTGADEYERERLPRELADLVTTQSDDFRVFAIAQSVRQMPDGRINPFATQRIEATLSRSADMGVNDYPFGQFFSPSLAGSANNSFFVHRRGAYESGGAAAAKLNVYTTTERSALGTDMLPNTADDWIVPQKIEITSYQILR